MGYFVIIIFTTFLGSPPKFLPVAFKEKDDCINYLINEVAEKHKHMKVENSNNFKFLTDDTYSQFIICEKLEYPTLNTSFK